MEQLAHKSVNALTPNAATDTIDFVLPPYIASWSIHLYPKDDSMGSPDAPSIEVLYGVGSDFLSQNPAVTKTAAVNKDTVITSSDQVSKIRLKITNGSSPPNRGLTAELYGFRNVGA